MLAGRTREVRGGRDIDVRSVGEGHACDVWGRVQCGMHHRYHARRHTSDVFASKHRCFASISGMHHRCMHACNTRQLSENIAPLIYIFRFFAIATPEVTTSRFFPRCTCPHFWVLAASFGCMQAPILGARPQFWGQVPIDGLPRPQFWVHCRPQFWVPSCRHFWVTRPLFWCLRPQFWAALPGPNFGCLASIFGCLAFI